MIKIPGKILKKVSEDRKITNAQPVYQKQSINSVQSPSKFPYNDSQDYTLNYVINNSRVLS